MLVRGEVPPAWKMAAKLEVGKKRRVFLCYSYLSKSGGGIDEEKRAPSARTPRCVSDFVTLLVDNGVPQNSILSADEPLSATDWHCWYEESIKESLATLCFITPQFSEVVRRGIDECRQIPSTINQASVASASAVTTCSGGSEVAGSTCSPQHAALEPANMPHLPGQIVRRLIEDPQLTFVPIFLGQNRDVSLIPLVLQGRRSYAVQYPFVSSHIEGSSDLELQDLVEDVFTALLGLGDAISNSAEPSVASIGISPTSGNLFQDSRSFLSFGREREVILNHLSSRLRLPWDELAVHLGVSQSDIEAIKYNYPMDAREQAYQMLLKWTDDHATIATVARFAAAVTKPAKVNQQLLLDVLAEELLQHQL